jgi:hypothetical protein
MESRRRRPSASLVISFIALVVAVTGTAVAASKIGPNQLKANAVTSKKIKTGAVKSSDIGDGQVASVDLATGAVTADDIANGAITGAKVAAESLNDKNILDYEVIGNSPVKVTATEAGSEAAARTAAPENVLFTKGQLTIYAKCFRDTTGAGTVFGEIYARTSADGALLEGDDDLPGGGATLLNTNTLETDRQVDTQAEGGANEASYDEAEEALTSADGTVDLHLVTHIGVKQGTLPGGDGAFGAGNVCLFGGAILG